MNYLVIEQQFFRIIKLFLFCFFGFNVLLMAQEPITYETAFPNLSFEFPVEIQNAGDNSDRIFVVEQSGKIKVFQNEQNTVNQEVFLDLSNEISFSAGQEIGLLGLAFHPNYEENGYFYVYYTAQSKVANVSVEINLARYSVSSNNPNRGSLSSRLEIFSFDKNQGNSNHNGGKIGFGPDGYLYISVGDGGGGGDPNKNAQNMDNIFGSILRIDVDVDGSNPLESNPDLPNGNYEIPKDNPRVGLSGLGELYAWGIRNTWKFSFDTENNNLWGADVGQDDVEEINLIEKGGNYGWNKFEGNTIENNDTNLSTNPDIKAVFQYNHDKGDVSITGGYVYRGLSKNSLIQGKYIYADYVSGRVWSLHYDLNSDAYVSQLLFRTNGEFVSSFGLDESGELYFSGYGTEAKIYKIIGGDANNDPSTVSINGIGAWKDIGNGVNGSIEALVEKDGNIFVGGSFSEVENGIDINNFASYNKTDGWKSLGDIGPNGKVKAIAIAETGYIYIGGEFSSVDGVSAKNIAVWNGLNWNSLSSGTNGPVSKIAIDSKGYVYVGGAFETAGNTLVNNTAVWKGNQWEGLISLNSGVPGTNNEVRSIAIDENDVVYFGGNFDSAGGINANRIAAWDGFNWGTLGEGTSGFVQAILAIENYIYIGGNFILANETTVNRIARWNITSKEWEALGNGVSGNVNTLAYDGNYLFVGGNFETAGKSKQENYIVKNLARWNSLTGWEALGVNKNVGTNNIVKSIALSESEEELYASGNFDIVGDISVNNLAMWGLSLDCSDENLSMEYQLNGKWVRQETATVIDEGTNLVLSMYPNNIDFVITLPNGQEISGDYSIENIQPNQAGDYIFTTSEGCTSVFNIGVIEDLDICSERNIIQEYRINNLWYSGSEAIVIEEGTNLMISILPNDIEMIITLPNGEEVKDDYEIESFTPAQIGSYKLTTADGCVKTLDVDIKTLCEVEDIIPEYRLNNIWYSGSSDITVNTGDEIVLSMLPNEVDLDITLPNGQVVDDNYNLGKITVSQGGKYLLSSAEGCTAEINITVIDDECSLSLIPEYQINGIWQSGNSNMVILEGSTLVLSMLPNDVDLAITLPSGEIVGDNYDLGEVNSSNNGLYILTSSEGCQKEINIEVQECEEGSIIPEYQLNGIWKSGKNEVEVVEGTEVVLSMLPNDIGLEITLPNGEIVGDNYDLGMVDVSKNGVYRLRSENGCVSELELMVSCPLEKIIPEYQLNGIWKSGENEIEVLEGTEVVLSMLPNDIDLEIKLPNGKLVKDNFNLGPVTSLDSGIYLLISEEGCRTSVNLHVVKSEKNLKKSESLDEDFMKNRKSNELDIVDLIAIFPNPTKGKINIDLSSKLGETVDVRIINSNGQVVYFTMYNQNHSIMEDLDLSGLSDGVYRIIIEGVDFKTSKSIIVKK
ncbi:PQQ-dependent sugar dehydrogenase [uncultured Maribacter sp.]|uniref:PQQ-dependent sugar dehydrogenase n=1 Tax=uncultured Maribacter sp. TaxID=431308 RepID=UPI00261D7365|nr:PQQ-dependent sugar dehydrogenase [uncultured Maribacter sp.]